MKISSYLFSTRMHKKYYIEPPLKSMKKAPEKGYLMTPR